MCCDGAGELGVLVAGELLWEEAPKRQERENGNRLSPVNASNKKETGRNPRTNTYFPKVVPRYECSAVERWP